MREEYSFSKPEVFRTIVALLNDYKPMCGEKHREKVIWASHFIFCWFNECLVNNSCFVASFLCDRILELEFHLAAKLLRKYIYIEVL